MIEKLITSEIEMLAWGANIAKGWPIGLSITLEGELGVGKTTLVRGLLTQLGHKGPVKSPTYTLVESYEVNGYHIHHFDLYRLSDALELEFLGIRDYFNLNNNILIEWPSRGEGILPLADVQCFLSANQDKRIIKMKANTEPGYKLLTFLEQKMSE